MHRDNSSTNSNQGMQSPQSLYRGLYVRIARKLNVDPSYVSRVARGDRRSGEIEEALRQALEKISGQLGHTSSSLGSRISPDTSRTNRLKTLLKLNRNRIQKQWLAHSQADPNLRRVKIAVRKRTAPILPVIEETMKAMKLTLTQMAVASMTAAEKHGRLRQAQGFTAMALVEEYNLVRRCVFGLAQENYQQMDIRLLIQDLTQFGEALDLQTQRALKDYLAAN
jgi:transcriptional regulator with XRE-family HTH domain